MKRLLPAALLVAACGSKWEPTPPPEPLPVTEAEAADWGKRAAVALNACDRSALTDMIDIERIMWPLIQREAHSAAGERGLHAGARAGLTQVIEALCVVRNG